MKIIKVGILLIVICISILDITNRNRKAKINDNLNKKEENAIIKYEITIAKDVNIKIHNEQEQNEINIEYEDIIEKNEKNELKKINNNKNNINRKNNIKIEEEMKQEYNKEENDKYKEETKIEQGDVTNLLEMSKNEEQKTEPRLLKDNNVRIKFDD